LSFTGDGENGPGFDPANPPRPYAYDLCTTAPGRPGRGSPYHHPYHL